MISINLLVHIYLLDAYKCLLFLLYFQDKTCSKGFKLKVAALRLKIRLKMKDNFIGNKKIAKETRRNAELSQDEMLGKGMGEV